MRIRHRLVLAERGQSMIVETRRSSDCLLLEPVIQRIVESSVD
jgi:hypothetical protein